MPRPEPEWIPLNGKTQEQLRQELSKTHDFPLAVIAQGHPDRKGEIGFYLYRKPEQVPFGRVLNFSAFDDASRPVWDYETRKLISLIEYDNNWQKIIAAECDGDDPNRPKSIFSSEGLLYALSEKAFDVLRGTLSSQVFPQARCFRSFQRILKDSLSVFSNKVTSSNRSAPSVLIVGVVGLSKGLGMDGSFEKRIFGINKLPYEERVALNEATFNKLLLNITPSESFLLKTESDAAKITSKEIDSALDVILNTYKDFWREKKTDGSGKAVIHERKSCEGEVLGIECTHSEYIDEEYRRLTDGPTVGVNITDRIKIIENYIEGLDKKADTPLLTHEKLCKKYIVGRFLSSLKLKNHGLEHADNLEGSHDVIWCAKRMTEKSKITDEYLEKELKKENAAKISSIFGSPNMRKYGGYGLATAAAAAALLLAVGYNHEPTAPKGDPNLLLGKEKLNEIEKWELDQLRKELQKELAVKVEPTQITDEDVNVLTILAKTAAFSVGAVAVAAGLATFAAVSTGAAAAAAATGAALLIIPLRILTSKPVSGIYKNVILTYFVSLYERLDETDPKSPGVILWELETKKDFSVEKARWESHEETQKRVIRQAVARLAKKTGKTFIDPFERLQKMNNIIEMMEKRALGIWNNKFDKFTRYNNFRNTLYNDNNRLNELLSDREAFINVKKSAVAKLAAAGPSTNEHTRSAYRDQIAITDLEIQRRSNIINYTYMKMQKTIMLLEGTILEIRNTQLTDENIYIDFSTRYNILYKIVNTCKNLYDENFVDLESKYTTNREYIQIFYNKQHKKKMDIYSKLSEIKVDLFKLKDFFSIKEDIEKYKGKLGSIINEGTLYRSYNNLRDNYGINLDKYKIFSVAVSKSNFEGLVASGIDDELFSLIKDKATVANSIYWDYRQNLFNDIKLISDEPPIKFYDSRKHFIRDRRGKKGLKGLQSSLGYAKRWKGHGSTDHEKSLDYNIKRQDLEERLVGINPAGIAKYWSKFLSEKTIEYDIPSIDAINIPTFLRMREKHKSMLNIDTNINAKIEEIYNDIPRGENPNKYIRRDITNFISELGKAIKIKMKIDSLSGLLNEVYSDYQITGLADIDLSKLYNTTTPIDYKFFNDININKEGYVEEELWKEKINLETQLQWQSPFDEFLNYVNKYSTQNIGAKGVKEFRLQIIEKISFPKKEDLLAQLGDITSKINQEDIRVAKATEKVSGFSEHDKMVRYKMGAIENINQSIESIISIIDNMFVFPRKVVKQHPYDFIKQKRTMLKIALGKSLGKSIIKILSNIYHIYDIYLQWYFDYNCFISDHTETRTETIPDCYKRLITNIYGINENRSVKENDKSLFVQYKDLYSERKDLYYHSRFIEYYISNARFLKHCNSKQNEENAISMEVDRNFKDIKQSIQKAADAKNTIDTQFRTFIVEYANHTYKSGILGKETLINPTLKGDLDILLSKLDEVQLAGWSLPVSKRSTFVDVWTWLTKTNKIDPSVVPLVSDAETLYSNLKTSFKTLLDNIKDGKNNTYNTIDQRYTLLKEQFLSKRDTSRTDERLALEPKSKERAIKILSEIAAAEGLYETFKGNAKKGQDMWARCKNDETLVKKEIRQELVNNISGYSRILREYTNKIKHAKISIGDANYMSYRTEAVKQIDKILELRRLESIRGKSAASASPTPPAGEPPAAAGAARTNASGALAPPSSTAPGPPPPPPSPGKMGPSPPPPPASVETPDPLAAYVGIRTSSSSATR